MRTKFGDDKTDWAVRAGGAILVLFVVSWFKSCEQLSYVTRGQTDHTKVSSISENRDKYGQLVGYTIHYGVNNKIAGRGMRGSSGVGIEDVENYDVGQSIEVVYVGDELSNFSSQIKGTENRFWPIMFVIFLLMLLAGVIWIVITIVRETRSSKR